MYIGYARVSTSGQNLDMQLDALTQAGCIQIFEEKMTGKRKNRPELDAMLKMLRPGDTVVVYKLDRIGRSLKHLIELFEVLDEKGVHFISLKEKIDTSSAIGKFAFHLFAALAEFEREMIKERTKGGRDAARARGRTGGRPAVDKKQIEKALKLYDSKAYHVSEIVKLTGISHTTLYRYIKKRKEEKAGKG